MLYPIYGDYRPRKPSTTLPKWCNRNDQMPDAEGMDVVWGYTGMGRVPRRCRIVRAPGNGRMTSGRRTAAG